MKKFVVVFFGFTWLVVIAGAAAPFGAMEGLYNEHAKYCGYKMKHRCVVIATSIADFINDTLILLAYDC